jgi:hypothetical protein
MGLLALLGLAVMAGAAGAQEVAALTVARQNAVNELFADCVKAGAVKYQGKGVTARG